jgi:replication factor C small subunit
MKDTQLFPTIEEKQVAKVINGDWNEKYRPQTLDEIIGQEQNVTFYRQQLLAYRKPKNEDGSYPLFKMRNAIFKGRCGVGKTSLARVLAKEFDVDMIEINGSDDRSLNKMRQRVVSNFRYAPFRGRFKLFVIDEIENLLNEAWMLLKSPIENTKTSTVVFICNDDKNIPEAIVSRCDVRDFAPIEKSEVIKGLNRIAEKENFMLEEKIANIIYDKSRGDLRKAVATLENYHNKSIQLGINDFDDIFVLR